MFSPGKTRLGADKCGLLQKILFAPCGKEHTAAIVLWQKCRKGIGTNMKSLCILGSTGSIGRQALDVCRQNGYRVEALAAGKDSKTLAEQARAFGVSVVAIYDQSGYQDLKLRLDDTSIRVLCGAEGVCELAGHPDCDIVLNAIVGVAGLLPTIAAIKAKKCLALANKESLVTAGELVTGLAKQNGVRILPVDSEHSAIFQCLQGNNKREELKKIILTASGGPFFGRKMSELSQVTLREALSHPNWSMGAKITVDSATMMNKGLEVIEAAWLFNVTANEIGVVVHRESVVHSAVEFIDGSVIAQMGVPDMRLPIQYAITYPKRVCSPVAELSLIKYGTLTFLEPDEDTFVCLNAAKQSLAMGGLAPCVVNGANEEAVALFLQEELRFTDIGELVCGALKDVAKPFCNRAYNIDDVLDADKAAREYVRSRASVKKKQ